MGNTVSYKKFFVIASIIICLSMLLAIIMAAVFIDAMGRYTHYLNDYFYQEMEYGSLFAKPETINVPIANGRDYAYHSALISMPIVATVLTTSIIVLYIICYSKAEPNEKHIICYSKAEPNEKQAINRHYLTFLNAGVSFIVMTFLEYTAGRFVTLFSDNAFGLAISGVIRWMIMYFATRFVFIIIQIVISHRTMKKREITVRIIYSVASFTVFIFYTILAISYRPATDAFYTTVLGFFCVPACLILFEGILLFFKNFDKNDNIPAIIS